MANHLDRIGKLVGDYRLQRLLGGGGFGVVYLAQHIRNRTQVAIKLLNARLSHQNDLKVFINEARTIRLHHAHIVPLLDFGISQEDIPYLVMEYAAAGTLRDRYPKGVPVPLPLIVNYAQQVGSALQYAHAQRLIHRDVKPQNMLLRSDGTVLLSDFGLATIVHSSDSLSSPQEAVGTIAYMAPEQIQELARTESDQYSLGVVVYEWIAGHCPFEGTSTEIAVQHLMKAPPSLIAHVPGLSRAVEDVVLKALAKDPRDRFVTIQDFTAALEQAARKAPAILDEYRTSPLDNREQVELPSTGNLPVSSSQKISVPSTRVDWDDAQSLPFFYGREEELATLSQWVLQEHCHVVGVLGIGGIGKSALSVKLMHKLSEHFEVVIFRTLRDAPACEAVLEDCLQILSPQPVGPVPASLEGCLSLLMEHLRKIRAFIVLDNMESLLETGDVGGHFRPGFEGYEQLLHRVSETSHQSCLLFTSREKPAALRGLASRYASVHSLHLAGLDVTACQQLFGEKKVVGTKPEQKQLIEAYSGNPLALKITAEMIIDLFGGRIGPFLGSGTVVFGNITDLLSEQYVRLSALEQCMLYWLAILREPVTLEELLSMLVLPKPAVQVLEAVDSLHRRSLIERGKRPGSFTLQSVVLEYITALLVAEGSREIKLHRLDRLIQHSLEQATAREHVRQTQARLLLLPLLANLQSQYAGRAEIEQELLGLIDSLRHLSDTAQGYGPANLMALLRRLRGNLKGLDLSHLCIRSAYLLGVEMQEAKLAFALIRDTVWTEAVSATWKVAISQDGTLWAACGVQGEVRIWREGGKTLHLSLSAHTDIVQALAFSTDGRMLASGSLDSTVKLWDVETGTLLWMDWLNGPQCLAFSPDGSLLAGSGLDKTLRLWSTQNGKNLQNVEHPAPVFTLAWSPDGSLLASGCLDGHLRLWERRKAESLSQTEVLQFSMSWETNTLWSLAFAPDGSMLASSSWGDPNVWLWEVRSGRLVHVLEGKATGKGNNIVWSPDGRTLACCSYENTIRLWDVEQQYVRLVLSGHTASIKSMAFTPDSHNLLSGGADSTLRVWDAESGHCVRVMQNYAVSLYCLDWSPDGSQLVSGGTDGVITIWDIGGKMPPRELRGHAWLSWGVGWSPNGNLLASTGWDMVTRLWDPSSGACVQTFKDPSSPLQSLAWKPDGSFLAVTTSLSGMYVWDVKGKCCHWIGKPGQPAFLSVAWSPDGRFLASGSDDGCVSLWEGTDGTERVKLQGHHDFVMSLAWSPDGKFLASGSGNRGNGELFLWDMQAYRGTSGDKESVEHLSQPIRCFAGHPGRVYTVAWSPSGHQLISGGSDGMLRLWDGESGECLLMQDAYHGTIRSLKVSPNGKFLASCGDDGAIRIWDLERFSDVRTLRRDRPYERMDITGIRGLNEAEVASLHALGAIEGPASPL